MTDPDTNVTYVLTVAPQEPHLFSVTFSIEHPADEHEARLRLITSRQAWESQGSPSRLGITMRALAEEPPP